MSEGNVLLQNLRDFTVQVRNRTGDIVGTGFLVSRTGIIVTCRHVIKEALSHKPISKGTPVNIYLPQLTDEKLRKQTATILEYLEEYVDDIMLIQLESTEALSLLSKVAVLGDGEFSQSNPFTSYGYRRLEKYQSGRAIGIILGSIERPDGQVSLSEPIEIKSDGINSGMSGSAVLDMHRNLVVGVVTETWYSATSPKNRETSWAVNTKILSLKPFHISISHEDHPRTTGLQLPEISIDIKPATSTLWNLKYAPAPVKRWVDRPEILDRLTSAWSDSSIRITSLVAFGGQGKTSLARQWVDRLQSLTQDNTTSLFWWTFYAESSIDQFFDAALNHVSENSVSMNSIADTLAKAQIISAIARSKCVVFVLDGLEVAQFKSEDEYGLFKDKSIQWFLSYLADSSSKSFCLITSRIPLIDLMPFTTHTSYDVEGLTDAEGMRMLKMLGLKGSDDQLKRITKDWGGHPLTLSLLSTYIFQQLNGDLERIEELSASLYQSDDSDPLKKILGEYEKIFSPVDTMVVSVCSVFRYQVPAAMFSACLDKFRYVVEQIDSAKFSVSIAKLLSFRILQLSDERDHYQLHPLVRKYFQQRVLKSGNNVRMHMLAKETFLALALYKKKPTLEELNPFIEATYHACRAGHYDEALVIYLDHIDKRTGYMLFQCGAYETALYLLAHFFEDNDPSKAPLLQSPVYAAYILRALAICHMTVGRLLEAKILFDRGADYAVRKNLMIDFAKAVQVRSELNIYLGRLSEGAADAEEASAVYATIEKANARLSYDSLSWGVQNLMLGPELHRVCAKAYAAWIDFLQGNTDKARTAFEESTHLLHAADPSISSLRDLWGIYYSDFLRLTGEPERALKVAQENLSFANRNIIPEITSQCERVIGDIEVSKGNIAEAQKFYDLAIKEARVLTHKAALIEVLISMGRLDLLKGALEMAWRYLQEVLEYCVESRYQLYQVDARIVIAQVLTKMGKADKACAEIEAASSLAKEINYQEALRMIRLLRIEEF